MLNPLEKRILEISYKNKLGHLSSCLTAVNIIDEIYQKKNAEGIFVLSQGHAGLALYCVLEKYEGLNAEDLYNRHGTHPNRNLKDKIYCSSGSLGSAVTIGLGIAIARRPSKVYCLISDGEAYEGSVWEALNFKEKYGIDNFILYVNINNFSCLEDVDGNRIAEKILCFDKSAQIRFTNYDKYPFLKGVQGHYYNLTEQDIKNA